MEQVKLCDYCGYPDPRDELKKLRIHNAALEVIRTEALKVIETHLGINAVSEVLKRARKSLKAQQKGG